MDASRIVDSLDEGERKEERSAQNYRLENVEERSGEERRGVREGGRERRFKGEENQRWLEFCKGLQTISAGLSGFGLSK